MNNYIVIVRHAERLDDITLHGTTELEQNPVDYHLDPPLSFNGHQ
jgi:hypothetical protein